MQDKETEKSCNDNLTDDTMKPSDSSQEKQEKMSEEEIRKRLACRAAEYFMFMDD